MNFFKKGLHNFYNDFSFTILGFKKMSSEFSNKWYPGKLFFNVHRTFTFRFYS